MVLFAYPDTLFNMSVEAVGVYLSDFMRRLITDPTYRRGPDGKYHHHQEPCIRLQEYINSYVPPCFAEEFTHKVMRYVNITYEDLTMNTNLKTACEEIAPFILKSAIHTSVKRLDFIRNEEHPTLLEYYKIRNCNLIYRTLPLLRDLKELRLGNVTKRDNLPLEVEGFKDTLEDFSCENVLMRDLETLANKCKQIRCLDINGDVRPQLMLYSYVSKFTRLEKLDLSHLCCVSQLDLQLVVYWLAGILCFKEDPNEAFQNLPTSIEGASKEFIPAPTRACPAEPLKFFGCRDPRENHISAIARFSNLTSLVLHNVQALPLKPLQNLKLLVKFTLIQSSFYCVQDFLQSVGSQLRCLNIRSVASVDLTFISHNCSNIECLHLYLPVWKHNSLPFPHFPRVFALELFLYRRSEAEDILSRFLNLKKLSTVNNFNNDLLLFDFLMERKCLTHLEELYWGCDTVITFRRRTATKHQFRPDGKVIVQHLQM
jgi:hypothetical protein